MLLGSAELGGEHAKDPAHAEALALLDALRRPALTAADEEAVAAARRRADFGSRIDPGLVHQEDIKRLRQQRSSHDVKIAVLHHPVSPLPFTEVARFGGLLNAGEVKDALVEHQVCLVLHGHAHMGWFGQEQFPERETRPDWVLRIAAAPSLGSSQVSEQHGYNEIAVAREPGEKGRSPYTVTVRRVVRKGPTWDVGKTMGPFAPGV